MITSKAGRLGAFLATVGLSATLVGTAVHTTGAYFSDAKAGGVSGTIGSIKVATSGGAGANGLDFTFANLLPGESQTASGSYLNTGKNAQDVWVVFNNPDALSALNNLGTYGEVHVASNGTEIFASQNLNDNATSCPPGAGPPPVCAPLPKELKLGDNVAPGLGGTFAFSFNYASKLKGAAAEEQPFNCYPLADYPACTHNGLPYEIVATQHGVDPYNSLNTTTP